MRQLEWEYGCAVYNESNAKEMEELLDFANMVFSMGYGGTDFGALLPKAYSPERWDVLMHYMIREDGRIRALIDSYPIEMKLSSGIDSKITAVYVGTVSVHPASRGKGYMIELMKRVEEDAVRRGCALMILDGDRHRYQYFGYERAGIGYRYQIERNNIRHCCAAFYSAEYMASPIYSFEVLDKQSPYIDFLYGLYERRAVTARTREVFWLCLQSYNAAAYVILRDDAPVGYVNLSEDERTVLELELEKPNELPRVIHDLMIGFDLMQIGVKVGADETEKCAQFEKMCDTCSAVMSHQIKILDYEAVFTFLLKWKQQYHALAEGEYVIGVQEDGTCRSENYLLSVTKDEICALRTERPADIVFDALALVRMLTTPCWLTAGLQTPAGWFPLPFYLPEADTF